MKLRYLGKICLAISSLCSMFIALSLFHLKWLTGEVIALFSLSIWIISFLDAWEPKKQIDKTNQLLEDILKSLNNIQQNQKNIRSINKEQQHRPKISIKNNKLEQIKNIKHNIR